MNGVSIKAMAPTLMHFVSNRSIKRLTVVDALPNRQWTGGVTVSATTEYLQVWHAICNVTLTEDPDRLVWRWASDDKFSVRTAYQTLHVSSHATPGCIKVWEVWAPLRVKLFLG